MNRFRTLTCLALAALAGVASGSPQSGEAVELARAGMVYNDPTRNPGGSSGGSAAAVADGLVMLVTLTPTISC